MLLCFKTLYYIAVSDHLWYGSGGIGVYHSMDTGLTWQATALAFDFADNKDFTISNNSQIFQEIILVRL